MIFLIKVSIGSESTDLHCLNRVRMRTQHGSRNFRPPAVNLTGNNYIEHIA